MRTLLFILTTIVLFTNSIDAQNIDSLYSDYNNPKSSSRINSANILCKIIYKKGICDTLVLFNKKTDILKMDTYVHKTAADWFLYDSRYKEAVKAAIIAARAGMKLGYSNWTGNCYSLLCVAYQRLGNLELAIEYGKKCYDMDSKSKNKENMSSDLNNLATLCLYDHKITEAKEYIDNCLMLERPLKRNEKLAIRLGTASEVYTALKQYSKAIEYAEEAYLLDKRDGRVANSGKRLAQLAYAYYSKGDNNKARKYYLMSISILQEFDIKTSLTICYTQLGTLEMKMGNFTESKEHLLKAVDYATTTNNKVQLEKACESLSELLEKSDPSLALSYLNKAFKLQQELFNKESENQINNFNTKYQAAERELQIEHQKAELYRRKVMGIALLAGLLICFIFLGIYVRVNLLLRKRNVELAQANTVKDKFFSLISHDLKNPVVAQRNMLKLVADNYDTLSQEQLHKICRELSDSSESLHDLLYNLLNWSRLETGRIDVQPINFPLRTIIEDTIKFLQVQLDSKSLKVIVNLPDNAIANGDANMTTTIIRNLLGNAIKFSRHNTTITISATEKKERWAITVTDEGIGLPPGKIDSLFKLSTKKSTPGTDGELGTGLGLVICREMVERNGGTISAKNNAEKGAQFIFTLRKGS
jgi:signal transduction histidine kinase